MSGPGGPGTGGRKAGGIRPSRAGSHKALELARARGAAARSGAAPWAADPRSKEDAAAREAGRRAARDSARRASGDAAKTGATGRRQPSPRPGSRVAWRASGSPSATGAPFPVLIIGSQTAGIAFKLRPPAVEVRADLFPRDAAKLAALMDDLRSFSSVLLTARRDVDGGRWPRAQETERRRFLLKLVPHADCVDVELDLAEDEAARDVIRQVRQGLGRGASLMISQHDCGGLPPKERLDTYLAIARYVKPARFKLAALVRTAAEAKRLCGWAIAHHSAELPITAIGMGNEGAWTRWFLPNKLGGPAYAPAGRAVAPGQVTYGRLVEELFGRGRGTGRR